MKTRGGYSHQPQWQQGQFQLTEMIMFVNAMAETAAKEGLSIKQLLKRRRKEAEKLPLREQGKPRPKRRDSYEGLSTRELYMRRPMD